MSHIIFAQSENLSIQNVIHLNGDGADDLVCAPSFTFDLLPNSEVRTDIPDIQIVYGDADLGTV
ncbi:MAG: hypothetical protein AAFO95_01260 [Cyanobacteria bacterium J06600_6]